MQVNIEQETLSKAIGQVLGVVDKRGTMPILSHCLLQTDGNGVFISATDLEISFRGFVPAEVKEPGAITVRADYFKKVISDLPKGPLGLVSTDKAAMQIRTGDSQYKLNGLPAKDFPTLPEAMGEYLLEVNGRFLQEMIDKTIFSVARDNQYINLTGIFWEQVSFHHDGPELDYWLRLAGTDGHRLTLVERPLPENTRVDIMGEGILVPCKGMREIGRFVDGQEKVTLGLGDKTLSVQAADKYLFVRLLDPKFPDYRRIIPEGFAYRFSIKREELSDTLKRMTQLSSDCFKGVIFNLTADFVEITFGDPEVGEGREMIPVILESGDRSQLPLGVGFNARYLMELLQAMSDDTVFLEINDRDRPCRLMAKEDPHYFSIIMPMSDVTIS